MEDIDKLKQIFIEFLNLKTDDYYLAQISDIVFTYKLVENSKVTTKITRKTKTTKEIFINDTGLKFSGYNLPTTMDITLWGDYHFYSDTEIIVYKKGSNLEYHIKLFDQYQLVE